MPLKHTQPGIALVTGASSGVGRSAAVALSEAGWTVVVCARRADALEDTVRLSNEKGNGKARAVAADLAKPEDIKRLFATIKEEFGAQLNVFPFGRHTHQQVDWTCSSM